ncbi:glycine C-acetyltransferase [Geomonas subterranea]|uniref:Glycine C-acetyltransferase n=1 Tax=Geomonas subterranea TaxID=2847989 RepID=A0ABX8LH36_9BACT|nr:glycine C-acetyltransferase [Geomonas subterranea]QXE89999.1 glycine C-acetyltransferase [Geomonas subterranea]QXM07881.1 glycine C-acetyltransferase [Geomonas subterranea]
MADKFAWITEEMNALEGEGLRTTIRTIGSACGPWMVVDGKKVLNFCTNNYLGLANHPRLKKAAQEAVEQWGVGPAAVRSIAGTLELHRTLEQRLAAFKGVEDALYVQSGFCANQAAIPPMVGKGDVIFTDRLNHASIIDGCRLSSAKILVYEHCDLADCERVITENIGQYRRALLITDGVFSMDGDVAPLDQLFELCERHGIITMVDDAHGEGVLGNGGRGIVDHFHLNGKFDLEIGTLSKAFGVMGGVIAGKKVVIDWIRQKARPFLFSSAVTAADTAACLAAVDLLEESTALVHKLWDNTRYFKDGMRQAGFDIGVSVTPITPVMLGEATVAQEFSRRLFAAEPGIFAMPIGFPTVPQGKARIRVMISAAHTQDDLETGLKTFTRIGRELGVIG